MVIVYMVYFSKLLVYQYPGYGPVNYTTCSSMIRIMTFVGDITDPLQRQSAFSLFVLTIDRFKKIPRVIISLQL